MWEGRAQAGIEFTICIIFLIMIIIIFTIYAGSKQTEEWNIKSKLESEKMCWQVSNLINTAMYSRGYYAEFSLPMKIDGSDYNLSITNNAVAMDYREHSCIYQITVTNISFGSKQTPFSLCGGDFYINNTDNGVIIGNRSAVGC
jgi:uncharacterized protein (UPF0333 family)